MIQIRLSQARLSSTVRPEREKFMSSKATEAVTMAAIVEMARIWVYTSCMISLALVHTSVAIYINWQNIMDIITHRKAL